MPASEGDGLSKSAADWKTLLIFGCGKGLGIQPNNDPTYRVFFL
jgi:hypothetical protein